MRIVAPRVNAEKFLRVFSRTACRFAMRNVEALVFSRSSFLYAM